jgi:2',3'-cyclic-nucleotide 2'-phosphodiesterase (5'-nucleotidase family)
MKQETVDTASERRKFLKNIGKIGIGLGVIPAISSEAIANESNTLVTPNLASSNDLQTIQILQTTDVHCQIYPHDELFWEKEQLTFRKAGGYAHLATYFNQARKRNPNTFILDTGDMFQGSELAVKTTGKALVPVLNAMGYNLYLPGNWEVVYYKKAMQTLMGALTAPKVCANMYHDLGDGKKGELIFNPYYIWQVGGIKIGFLGYTDPLVPLRQSPNYSKGIIYTKPEENLKHYVDVLKNDEQCAFVIILSHLGLSQQIALANDAVCQGVDYIFGGDTQERLRTPIVCKYTNVVEPGAFGSFVGRLELKVQNGKVISDTYTLDEVEPEKLKADKAVSALIKTHEEPFAKDIYEIAGYSTIPLYRNFVIENTIDTMILDAIHWQLPQMDIVLSNGFRFCPPRSTPDSTGNIPITNGFIYDMLPVDSTIRTAKVNGKQILDWLEKELNNVFAKDAAKRFGGWVIKFKGMEVSFKAFEEMGKRVQSVLVKGQPLDQNAIYSICACERDGDPADMLCRIKNVAEAANTSHTLHQVMKEYLKNNSPVSPKLPLRAKILDAPQTLLSQVYGVPYKFE